MRSIELDGYFVPGAELKGVKIKKEFFKNDKLKLTLRLPKLSPESIDRITVNLKKQRRQYLSQQPIMHIVDVLDKAARLWLDPSYHLRKIALEAIPLITGLSREMVEKSIEIEQRSSLKKDIINALRSELSDPYFLDGFRSSAGGADRRSRAIGPDLIAAIFSGNIPALPHLSIMRALLVKSACLGKVASGEPVYAVLYARTIREIDPEMAKAIAVLNWKGGDKKIEKTLFSAADTIVAYGSEDSCNAIRQSAPPCVKVITHSHKLGFGIIAKNALKKKGIRGLAQKVAYDISMFDQQACLAPHIYFVEKGGEISPLGFSEILAAALARMDKKLPRGRLGIEEASRINQLRGVYELKECSEDNIKVFAPQDSTSWTVIYERIERFVPSCLNRVIRVAPLDDIFEVIELIGPVSKYLQNVGVAIDKKRERKLFDRLCALGVSRITGPGNMPTPSIMWHHDGRACIGELVRWCDIEGA